MNEVVGFNMHRGVLAVGRRGAGLTPEGVLDRPGPWVVLEDLTNHDNLGGLFRNVAALGGPGAGVLLSPRCADPLYRKSLRVSMGTILSVPFARLGDWPGGLAALRDRGIETWALTPGDDARPIGEVAREAAVKAARVALVLGSEGPGLTPGAFGACTRRVVIPMRRAAAEVDSLNVAMAGGVALYALGEAGLVPG
jgi:tRNA G18 (ribose-2'-O)-methylase SpoU